jgi:hypothetical protein
MKNMGANPDVLVGKPRLRESIRAASGRFCEGDVTDVIAIHTYDGGGSEDDKGYFYRLETTWWIVRLRSERGLPFGGVQASWKEGCREFRNLKPTATIVSASTILGVMMSLPDLHASKSGRVLLGVLDARTRAEVNDSAQRAIGRLLEGGSLLVEDIRNEEHNHLKTCEVASLRIRLDDTFAPPQRSEPDGEPFRVSDALDLLAIHDLDPVHGLHAWGVSARRESPSGSVRDELSAAGYNVDALISGLHPWRSLPFK